MTLYDIMGTSPACSTLSGVQANPAAGTPRCSSPEGEGASLTCISSCKENACLHAKKKRKKNHLNAALRTVEHGFFTTRAKVTVRCDHYPSLMCDLQTRVHTIQDTTHTHNNYAGLTSFLLLLLHLLVLLLADTTLQVGAWSAQWWFWHVELQYP